MRNWWWGNQWRLTLVAPVVAIWLLRFVLCNLLFVQRRIVGGDSRERVSVRAARH